MESRYSLVAIAQASLSFTAADANGYDGVAGEHCADFGSRGDGGKVGHGQYPSMSAGVVKLRVSFLKYDMRFQE